MPVTVARRHAFAAALLLAFAASGQANAIQAEYPLSAEVQDAAKVLDAFHAALRRGDRDAALSLLADEALIYESGHAERKIEYAAHHLASDIAFAKAVPATITIRSGKSSGSLAWVTTEGRTAGTFKEKAVDRRTIETAVLQSQAGKWQILHLHWSSAAIK